MASQTEYSIHLDAKFRPLEVMDIPALIRENNPWWNQTLCKVNDCVVRLGIVEGDFHWHKHENEDEFFYVISGKWIIELEGGRIVELAPGQGFTVPKGVMHFPRAPERTVILMMEGAGVIPTGN
ncbi:MAG TPA: cupin domain-containing protein [Terriglobales bacterium]|jgi:mannose-6-phosphate isomerase-like protein (cupin superfamily)